MPGNIRCGANIIVAHNLYWLEIYFGLIYLGAILFLARNIVDHKYLRAEILWDHEYYWLEIFWDQEYFIGQYFGDFNILQANNLLAEMRIENQFLSTEILHFN